MGPPEPELDSFLFIGATSSLGLYYYPVLMPCFTALFTIVRGTAHCTVLEAECFRGIDSPRLGICCRLQPLSQTLTPSRRPADFVAGVLSGVAPRACFGSGNVVT